MDDETHKIPTYVYSTPTSRRFMNSVSSTNTGTGKGDEPPIDILRNKQGTGKYRSAVLRIHNCIPSSNKGMLKLEITDRCSARWTQYNVLLGVSPPPLYIGNEHVVFCRLFLPSFIISPGALFLRDGGKNWGGNSYLQLQEGRRRV